MNSDNLCDECLIYWKKYGAYQYNYSSGDGNERPGPDQRQERLEASRSQLFTCNIDNCRRSYKEKTDFARHSLLSHAVIVKKLVKPSAPVVTKLHNFCMEATPLTAAVRLLADKRKKTDLPNGLCFTRKLARNPLKIQIACNPTIFEKCKFYSRLLLGWY